MARPKANAADSGSVHPHRSLTPPVRIVAVTAPVLDILFRVTGTEVPADHGLPCTDLGTAQPPAYKRPVDRGWQ